MIYTQMVEVSDVSITVYSGVYLRCFCTAPGRPRCFSWTVVANKGNKMVNYCFTFRLPDNPGYLSDVLWSRALMTYLILVTTRYEPELNEGMNAAYDSLPPSGQSELREALDRGVNDLLEQESGKRLMLFAEENIRHMAANVFGPWIKLFVLVQETDE